MKTLYIFLFVHTTVFSNNFTNLHTKDICARVLTDTSNEINNYAFTNNKKKTALKHKVIDLRKDLFYKQNNDVNLCKHGISEINWYGIPRFAPFSHLNIYPHSLWNTQIDFLLKRYSTYLRHPTYHFDLSLFYDYHPKKLVLGSGLSFAKDFRFLVLYSPSHYTFPGFFFDVKHSPIVQNSEKWWELRAQLYFLYPEINPQIGFIFNADYFTSTFEIGLEKKSKALNIIMPISLSRSFMGVSGLFRWQPAYELNSHKIQHKFSFVLGFHMLKKNNWKNYELKCHKVMDAKPYYLSKASTEPIARDSIEALVKNQNLPLADLDDFKNKINFSTKKFWVLSHGKILLVQKMDSSSNSKNIQINSLPQGHTTKAYYQYRQYISPSYITQQKPTKTCPYVQESY